MGEMNSAIGAGAASNEEVLSRIGHMTRALHESLRGLGLDKLIEKAASDIPDARDRLDYVARLSEQAAKKVLDATDRPSASSAVRSALATPRTPSVPKSRPTAVLRKYVPKR